MKRFLPVVLVFLVLMTGGGAWASPLAYIPNSGDNTVTVIDTGTPPKAPVVIPGLLQPYGVAVAPDARKVYVTNNSSNTVTVIDAATNTVSATITVGTSPAGIAITPVRQSGSPASRIYVANSGSGTVSVIDPATNSVVNTMTVGTFPVGVAVNGDSSRAYVSNKNDNTVSVIDLSTNTVMAPAIAVGTNPAALAVTPDGKFVYVCNGGTNTVSVIDTSTNTVVTTIAVGDNPAGIAVLPDGSKVYVSNGGSSTVSVITVSSQSVVDAIINVGLTPSGVAVTPDSKAVYVANSGSKTVSVIDITTSANTVTGVDVGLTPIALGNFIVTETIAPFVIFKVPGDASFKVVRTTVITAMFSQPMDPATIVNKPVLLVVDSNGNPVAGTVGYVDINNLATFSPAAALNTDTTYTVTLSTEVKDLAGHNLTSPVSWSFTTESPEHDSGGCFIATAAFGSYLDPHVKVLRAFRDRFLLTNSVGRAFVSLYYKYSPPVAAFIARHEPLRIATRWMLTPVVYIVEYPFGVVVVFAGALSVLGRKRRKREKTSTDYS